MSQDRELLSTCVRSRSRATSLTLRIQKALRLYHGDNKREDQDVIIFAEPDDPWSEAREYKDYLKDDLAEEFDTGGAWAEDVPDLPDLIVGEGHIEELASAIHGGDWQAAGEALTRLYGVVEDTEELEGRGEMYNMIDSLQQCLDVLTTVGFAPLYSQIKPLILPPDAFQEVDRRVAEAIISKPEVLDSVDSRFFEELIASIYARLGFDVVLTKRTCDGGRDVVAIGEKGRSLLKFI